MAKIGGVAVEQLRRKTNTQTERRRADFGDQLLEGVGLVAEAFAEGAVQPVRRARPVQLLVRLGRQEVVACVEGVRVRQADQRCRMRSTKDVVDRSNSKGIATAVPPQLRTSLVSGKVSIS